MPMIPESELTPAERAAIGRPMFQYGRPIAGYFEENGNRYPVFQVERDIGLEIESYFREAPSYPVNSVLRGPADSEVPAVGFYGEPVGRRYPRTLDEAAERLQELEGRLEDNRAIRQLLFNEIPDREPDPEPEPTGPVRSVFDCIRED